MDYLNRSMNYNRSSVILCIIRPEYVTTIRSGQWTSCIFINLLLVYSCDMHVLVHGDTLNTTIALNELSLWIIKMPSTCFCFYNLTLSPCPLRYAGLKLDPCWCNKLQKREFGECWWSCSNIDVARSRRRPPGLQKLRMDSRKFMIVMK